MGKRAYLSMRACLLARFKLYDSAMGEAEGGQGGTAGWAGVGRSRRIFVLRRKACTGVVTSAGVTRGHQEVTSGVATPACMWHSRYISAIYEGTEGEACQTT